MSNAIEHLKALVRVGKKSPLNIQNINELYGREEESASEVIAWKK